jgi:hypothetical protein
MLSEGNQRQQPLHTTDPWRCPFFHTAAASCQAAIPARTPPRVVRATTCDCGDYEDCTTFLARLLNRRR